MAEYILISGLTSASAALGSAYIPIEPESTGSAVNITVDGLFENLSTLRTTSASGLVGRTDLSDYNAVHVGTGLIYSGSVISGSLATTSVKGVASFDSDHFTVSSGAVSITNVATTGTIPIDHDRLENFVSNEHIDHTGVTINTSGTGLTGGGFNLTAGTKTITLTSASAPTAANTIARTGADNYLNGMVKDLVYIQLFPLLETIVASPTTPLGQFFIPSVCANKSIKKIGLATWEQVGTGEGLTLTVKNESGTSVGTVSLIPTQYTAESSVNYSLSGHSRLVFYITSVTGTITGADAWLELG